MTNAQESLKQALAYRKAYAIVAAVCPELDVEQVKVQALTALTDIDLYVTIGEVKFPIAIPAEYQKAIQIILELDGYSVTVIENGLLVNLEEAGTLVDADSTIDWAAFDQKFGSADAAKAAVK